MTSDDAKLLMREDIRKTISDNIDADPAKLALSLKEYAPLIATQVKYLRRAKSKLPSYYNVQAIIPPLAFEQSSSERTASEKKYSGEVCIDLTCGLGVYSFYLSKNFGRVISLEKDKTLAEIARYNFGLLGVENTEVLDTAAEDFLSTAMLKNVDLIYCDPARRSEKNGKLVLLEECSPNIIELLPHIKTIAKKLVVKASPLFDVDEAFRIFGNEGAVTVVVVSSGGECKEVIIEIDFETTVRQQMIRTSIAGGMSLEFSAANPVSADPAEDFHPDYKYLLIPDVSLYKARTAVRHVRAVGGRMFSPTGYAFSDSMPADFAGTVFGIEQTAPFQPKALKNLLKKRKIKNIMVYKKDFSIQGDEIAKQLGVGCGEDARIAFTSIGGKKYAIFLK